MSRKARRTAAWHRSRPHGAHRSQAEDQQGAHPAQPVAWSPVL